MCRHVMTPDRRFSVMRQGARFVETEDVCKKDVFAVTLLILILMIMVMVMVTGS